MEELKRFSNDVMESSDMQTEIKEIGNDIEKLIAYANDKGYNFDLEDVKGIKAGAGELSEDELDSVAGGVMVAKIAASGVANALFIF
ncbi:Nif11-like leader peptide family RiPP precursor [Fusibacter paucivorans]|uniref:Nif11-like leader peptide family RiPP n=1 Tax=Fusibacter paucivorans TaxID=76009 RepID=A0ABS5PJV7_9FIRM|nr:Nif11-like leader peptide family RiPP precursor [Fusibacter paucivorans]MBS7525358.1 Nif11-like leader peptide family RiPP precursor [Fusibacter paucivorans]